MPVIEYYKQLGKVHAFDGSRPVDDVWTDTKSALEALEAKYK